MLRTGLTYMIKLFGGGSKSTLYCSFCGKSQYEVSSLIAGPKVFICDECAELCEEIIWDKNPGRVLIKVKLSATSAIDDILYEAISNVLGERFPDLDFRYECRTSDLSTVFDKKSNIAVFSAARVYGSSKGIEDKVLRDEMDAKHYTMARELAVAVEELSVMNTKFMHESQRNAEIAAQLVDLKSEYLDHLRESSAQFIKNELELRAVIFLDVSGFSRMGHVERQKLVDMLRGLTPTLLGDAFDINMWGDSVVATYKDANHALESATRFIRHLAVDKMDVRIGMAWGEIRARFNPATGRRDIDGDAVNFAARLEPMAPVGGILVSTEFGGLNIDERQFELIPVELEVKKPFWGVEVGDKFRAYRVRILQN